MTQAWRGDTPELPDVQTLAIEGQEGRPWYDVAHRSLLAFARSLGHEPLHVASVLAVTSPRVHVTWNVRYAIAALQGNDHPRMLTSVRAALAHYRETGEIRGPKTGAFRDALMGDQEAVVVDVWLARALGVADLRMEGKRYVEAADRVREVARALGWPPAEAQAAIWTGTRARYGHKPVQLEIPIEWA